MTTVQQFSGKIYPDYSFTVGRVPAPKKLRETTEYDKNYEAQFDSYIDVVCEKHRRIIRREKWWDGFTEFSKFIKSPQSSQKNLSYGKNGITRLGRRMVKNGAVLLERKFKISKLGFATATLPNYSRRILHILSKSWSEIVRRFFQKVKRLQERMQSPTEMVSCTEIQPKRYRKYGVVAPHIHFVYVCRTKAHTKKFTILASVFRRFWKESVEQVLVLRTGAVAEVRSFQSSVNCQVVKKSVAAYLGKYVSKGGEVLEEIKADGMDAFLPKQWWTATANLKKQIKEAIIILDENTCKALMYQLGDFLADGMLTWCNFVSVEIDGIDRIVGCVGTFSEESYDLLQG